MMSLAIFRKRLASPNTSWQICLLAIIGGIFSALLVVFFLYVIESLQQLYLSQRDNYISLNSLSRFELPIIGAVLILAFARLTGYQYLRTGIPFVLHRLKVANGVMPLRNTINQFVGSVFALAAGFSVGREGPAVHLGAACTSFIGSVLQLPYNSIRTLCACGVAAGIAATFNTPIAAVIFVMEVILREYRVHMFIPIMLSAIVGSFITGHVFGTQPEFAFLDKITLTPEHYPALIIFALLLGILAYGFNRYLILMIKHTNKFHIMPRLLMAALITGMIGMAVPFAMGTDISAINFSLSHQWQTQLLIGLLVAKIIMTISALGLGIPGGIIGPILGIGAIAGVCASSVVTSFIPSANLTSDFALMGMAGFMAATLNAPLAALLAVVELSRQIDIMLPAMIVITVSCIISGQFCKNKSIFVMQLNIQNLAYRRSPIEKTLQKIGVLAMMKDVEIIDYDDAKNFSLNATHNLDEQTENPVEIIKKAANNQYYWQDGITQLDHKLIPLTHQATLADAYDLLHEQRCGGIYVYEKDESNVIGIIIFSQLKQYLTKGVAV